MKKVFFPLLSLFFAACAPAYLLSDNPNDSFLMHVECMPGVSTRAEILLLLKRAKARDVHVEESSGGMTIEAAYYKADNDIGVLEEIADNLRQIGTVSYVEIRDNPSVVRQNR